MNLSGITGVLLLATGLLVALVLLPGLLLNIVALLRRLRGRPAPAPAILGPLFWHELVTVTRRGTQVRLRSAYTLLLLGGLLVAFLSQFREENPIRLLLHGGDFPRERVTAFATTFFQIFLFCQLTTLTLVAPVYAGAAIIEEKDRGTLAHLQTTLLSNREIVLGKLGARLLFVLALAFTGLPVLAISLLFGGVDPELLAVSFAVAAMSTISLAAYSFWQATRHDSLKPVLANSYTLVIALFFASGCCAACFGYGNFAAVSPFTLLLIGIDGGSFRRFDLFDATIVNLIANGFLAFLFAVLAMGNVRAILHRNPVPSPDSTKWVPANRPRWVETPPDLDPETSLAIVEHTRRDRPPPRFVRVPPIDDDQPFLWKELHFGGRLPSFEADAMRGCGLALLVATLLPVLFGVFVSSISMDRPEAVINPLFRMGSIALVAFIIPLAGARAVGCVANERRRQTLDSLLAIPVERSLILESKAWAALQWLRYWAFGFGALALVSAATGSVGIVNLLAIVALMCAVAAFFLALAVWLSVRCAETPRAMAWYLAIAFALNLVPPMLAVLVGGAADLLGASPQYFTVFTTAVAPPFAIDEISGLPNESRDTDRPAALAASGIACLGFLLGTIILWKSAIRRFECEGK
jgi:ABC-type transport system involved in multi-copper enzyme maturation permease subunit